jgi:glyoxylase-like metal-dependent hydrolase (beta-lactamase superfamily II)
MALEPPELDIPSSRATVGVRIINSTARMLHIPTSLFVTPDIKGYATVDAPAFTFLIEHSSGRKVLFDLGLRKDWENLPAVIVDQIKRYGWDVSAKKGIREILEESGVDGKDIEAIIWSHFHWDHTGDPSTFDRHTNLVVGPGFKESFMPGYPLNPESPILESDYEGREVRDVSFTKDGLKLGRFNAFDYFGDGSFYLLDSPGHAIGHLCGLARVTTDVDSYIFMGGDVCISGGQLRPSEYVPFPDSIQPHPFHTGDDTSCPGEIFEHLLPHGKTRPFYNLARDGIHSNPDEGEATISKVIGADAHNEVLIVMAHDPTVPLWVDFFPTYANDFLKKGWKEKGRWLFLKQFEQAVNI